MNNFLERLAALDIRRHACALKTAIKEDSIMRDAPLRNILIIIFCQSYPPIMAPMHFTQALEELGEDCRPELTRMHKNLHSNEMLIFVNSSRGGPAVVRQVHVVSTRLLNGPAEYGGDTIVMSETEASSIPIWSRTPAQSFKGKDLEFQLDEIDACLLDAHRNYRPGASGTDSSKPPTVFDYLEERIKDEELVPDLDYLEI